MFGFGDAEYYKSEMEQAQSELNRALTTVNEQRKRIEHLEGRIGVMEKSQQAAHDAREELARRFSDLQQRKHKMMENGIRLVYEGQRPYGNQVRFVWYEFNPDEWDWFDEAWMKETLILLLGGKWKTGLMNHAGNGHYGCPFFRDRSSDEV